MEEETIYINGKLKVVQAFDVVTMTIFFDTDENADKFFGVIRHQAEIGSISIKLDTTGKPTYTTAPLPQVWKP